MNFIEQFIFNVTQGVPNFIYAIALLIIAFIVAGMARRISKKVFEKLDLQKYTDKLGLSNEVTGSSVDFFGNLIYIIIFLLFVPAIFAKLGIQSATAPITSMVSQFLNFIPNIIAAVIIIVIGVFIAKIVKQLLLPILKRLKVDALQEKAGIQADENTSISAVLANVVYVLILLPMVIAALEVLEISAISTPAINMLNQVFAFLPRIFIALAIIAVGIFIANMIEKLLSGVLASIGVDTYIGKYVDSNEGLFKSMVLSKLIGSIVKYIIILLVVVEALNVIDLEVLQGVGQAVIGYLPVVISAVIIIGLAYALATWVEGMIKKQMNDANLLAFIVKTVIIVIGVIMTLSQLGIAANIVNAAFIIILSAMAVAFAISFGVGGRDFASRTMNKIDKKDK